MAQAFYSRSLRQWIELEHSESYANLGYSKRYCLKGTGVTTISVFIISLRMLSTTPTLQGGFCFVLFCYSTLWIYQNLGCFDWDAIIKSHYYRNSLNISLVHTQEWNSPQAFEQLPISKAPVPLWIYTRNEWLIVPIFSSSSPKLSSYFNHSSRYGMVADCE